MPHARPALTARAAERLCAVMFEPSERALAGLELEWPVHRRGDVAGRPGPVQMRRLAQRPWPAGGRVSFEPGGQAELSTAPHEGVAALLAAAAADEKALRAELDAAGLACETLAVDDRRPPRRVLDRARYRAMERFFAAQDGPGAQMMCNTASTQVNISHDQACPRDRWLTLHQISPVLIAAFANSPGRGPGGRRWVSQRMRIWYSIDAARTRPVRTDLPPCRAWLDYALAADVMHISSAAGPGAGGTAVPPGLSFGRWMSDGHEAGWPTAGDLRYHMSTLFPPVRPRGWLELRVLDALPGWIREVATLTVAVACTREAGRELRRRLPDPARLWVTAARDGIASPVLAAAAADLFAVAGDQLGSVTGDSAHADLFGAFRDRYVRRGRCPADDLAGAAAGQRAGTVA